MNKIVQWFVENPVAANLLMVLIFLGGVIGLYRFDKEAFPSEDTGIVRISAPYPGAGPKEVEEQVVIRIEEAIADLDGIKEITSVSNQGGGNVTVEAIENYDIQKLLNDVKTRVDAITTFPDDTERVQVMEQPSRNEIMNIAVYGDVDEAALKDIAQQIRDEVSLLPNITLAELNAARSDELSIEVSEETLRHYNLTFQQVVNAIRGASLNLPAGTIKASTGNIQLQTRGQAYYVEDFEQIVVRTNPDGGKLYLGDIATITDGFEESEFIALLNGQPSIYVDLFISDNPNVLKAREQVYAYLEELEHRLPPGIEVKLWQDRSNLFTDRMNLLLENAIGGLILVFVVLMLFLRPALAIWVCIGIMVSFAGCMWLAPQMGISLNMITLFGFLLVLGIVVDDAIIVGESIYARQEAGIHGRAAAASGAKMVTKPVIFAVISSIVFFGILLMVPGRQGKLAGSIAIIANLCLVFSLIESLLILPAHLTHMKPEKPSRFALLNKLTYIRGRFSYGMHWFADNKYVPFLKRALSNNLATISFFGMCFLASLAVFMGGWLRVGFMPVIEADNVQARVNLAEGVPFTDTMATLEKIKTATAELRQDPEIIEKNNGEPRFVENVQTWSWSNNIIFNLALTSPELRDVSTQDISSRWRELIGELPEAEEVNINFTMNNRGQAVNLRTSISSDNLEDQQRAVDAVMNALKQYPGVIDVKSNLQSERDEIELSLKNHAELLGLSLTDIARQVRQGFYGEEVQRIPRDKEDVRVMVRYPESDRRNVDHLEDIRIRTQSGVEVPLSAVADVRFVPSPGNIRRTDRKRTIIVTADLEEGFSAGPIVGDLFNRNLTNWQKQFPGFTLTMGGDMQEQNDFASAMLIGFVWAVLIIYSAMAIAFKSYWQPLIILTAIPFGFMGAVIGHLIMGREVSMMSFLGFIACAGVVVNDNLVLLDRINNLRKQGLEALEAVIQAGRDRFRAIILTSVTTFVGLVPILAETSMQARFLIPMVISLAFGVIFATVVTLILVPSLFLVAERAIEKLGKKASDVLAPSEELPEQGHHSTL